MKKRNPLAVFFLSIITFGIYDLYWLVVTKKELNQKTHTKTPTIWLLFAPFILLIGVTIALVVSNAHSMPTTTTNVTTNYSINSYSSSTPSGSSIGLLIAYFLAILIVLPISFYWFWKFSKAVNEYTSGTMSTAVAFLLLWLLHLIGVALVQDKFNDMIDQGTQPGTPGPNPSPQSPMPTAPPTQPPAPSNPPMPQSETEPSVTMPVAENQYSPEQPSVDLPQPPTTD